LAKGPTNRHLSTNGRNFNFKDAEKYAQHSKITRKLSQSKIIPGFKLVQA